jgi:hypothetical protein
MQYCNISSQLLLGVFKDCITPNNKFDIELFKDRIKKLNSNVDKTNGISEEEFSKKYIDTITKNRNFKLFYKPRITDE